MIDNILDGDDGIGPFGHHATRGDRHRLARLERARRGNARRDPGRHGKRPGRIRGTQREPVHRRAREGRQVDRRPRRLGKNAPGRLLEPHRLRGERTGPLDDQALGLLHRHQLGHRGAYRTRTDRLRRRDLGCRPRPRRGAHRRASLRRAPVGARAARAALGGRVRRRRLDRRLLRRADAAAQRPRERPRRPPPAQLRQSRRARRRFRERRGRRRRHDRRRSSGRPRGDPAPAREAGRGLRPRLRLEDPPPRPAQPAHSLEDLQLGDRARVRPATARPQLRAEGVSRRGREGTEAVRRAPPLHPGARPLSRLTASPSCRSTTGRASTGGRATGSSGTSAASSTC